MRAEVGHSPIERFLEGAGDLVGKDTAVPIRCDTALPPGARPEHPPVALNRSTDVVFLFNHSRLP